MNLEKTQRHASRGETVRALILFQLKLAVDGVKDVALMPLSILVGLYAILANKGTGPLNIVLRLGRNFDE